MYSVSCVREQFNNSEDVHCTRTARSLRCHHGKHGEQCAALVSCFLAALETLAEQLDGLNIGVLLRSTE